MVLKQFFASLMLALALSSLIIVQATAQTLYGSAGAQDQRENAVNVDWAYNWGIEPKHDVDKANFEFVPMIWTGNAAGVQGQIDRIFDLEENHGVHVDYVLGFNEPDLRDQANLTVAQGLATWDVITNNFENTDIKLVSPAVTGGSSAQPLDSWIIPFMDEVETRNADANPNNDLKVDAIAYHYYTVSSNAQQQADNLLATIDQLYEDYGRPIWLTEFAGTSFTGVHSLENRTNFNEQWLEILIPEFDARPYVERVAWWQFGAQGQAYSALSTAPDGVRTPTELGEIFSRATLEGGDTYNFASGTHRPTDVHYLKGGTLTNTGSNLSPALRAIDALEGSSIVSGSADFSFEAAEDAFVRVRDGSTIRKQGSNTVTLPEAPFYNDGTVLVQGGTLQLENGAQLTGVGSMRVDANGTLATSGGTGGKHVDLDSSIIILNNGMLHVKDGRANISQQLRFWNASEVRTDGDLVISGRTAGAGRILSTGSGTLFLMSDGEHVNGATVSQGSLIVANTNVSATGSGSVLVTGTGTLGGYGQVEGNVVVESGGSVAPGVSRSSLGLSFVDGVVVDAIDFDFNGVQDAAPLTQTSNHSSGLKLVSGLDFGPGVQPSGAANEGSEFNVSGFGSGRHYHLASDGGDYLTFTIAPEEGLSMVIEEVTVELRRNGGTAAKQYVIGSSIDGFEWPERWGNITVNDTATHEFKTASDLMSNEAVTGEVEIRIVGMDASSTAGNTHFYGASVDASFISDPNNVAFDPTGVITLGGNYTQLDFATLEIDLGGTSASAGAFDRLQVSGNVALDGTLDVSFVNGFNGTPGQTFDIITANSVSGTFDTVIAPDGTNVQVNYLGSIVRLELLAASLNCDAAGGMECDLSDIDALYAEFGTTVTAGSGFDYSGDGVIGPEDIVGWLADASQATNTANPTGVTYILGDADLDGNVNSTDLGLLLNNFNVTSVVGWNQGDLNGTGAVDSTDLGLLLNNFGSTSSLAASAVPEPSTKLPLIVICIAAMFRLRHRRKLLG